MFFRSSSLPTLFGLGSFMLISCLLPRIIHAEILDPIENPFSKHLDEVVVTSTPLGKTLFESAQPVTVLSETDLQAKSSGSLGAALASEPGISSTGFGPGAGRPIIRGLGGDRIRVLENGIGTQDVSNVSPDHAVTIQPSLVEKIEVVRGPAALLYGTSAVGGVVNIFDNRIPEVLPSAPLSGSMEGRGSSTDVGREGGVNLNAPAGPFAIHFDAFQRRTDDIHIPGFARTEQIQKGVPDIAYSEPKGRLPFSATDSHTITFGTSFIRDSGFLGASISNYNTAYGVPNGENNIHIDAERQRVDIHGKLFEPFEVVKSMDLKIGIVDYHHTEFEGEEPGTKFKNRGLDGRYEITHQPFGALEGMIGFQYQNNDFSALGAEAFQPPTTTNTGSGFLFEEYRITEQWKAQLGGRFDYQDVQASGYRPPSSDVLLDRGEVFPTLSQSAGIVWSPVKEYAFAFSLAHTERAPSGQELFANGPHVATGAFEIGDPNLRSERSVGVDLTVRRQTGIVTGFVGVFYNRFENYIGLIPAGHMNDDLHVYQFEPIAADFYGFESQVTYHFFQGQRDGHDLSIDFQPDYVRAEDRNTGESVPRIPPLRLKTGVNYERPNLFRCRLEAQHVFSQRRVSNDETETDGYTFLNATISKDVMLGSYPVEIFLQGRNLLNEKAREHTSFIKDVAPNAGASIESGFRVKF